MGYSLGGQENVTVLGNTTILGLSDGAHSVIVFANDTFGNMASSGLAYFSVDATAPTVIVLSPLNQTYHADSVALTFTLDESASWIGYSLDSQANVTVSDNATLSDLVDGNHDIVVYAADALGNTGISNTVYFSVDTTPPEIADVSQYPTEDSVFPDDIVSVNATVTDNISGISRVVLNYTTNNGTWFDVEMSHLEGSIWNATIPGFPYCTTVNYTIIAEDTVGNSITSEDLAYTLQYHVIPEFASYIALLLLTTATLLAAALLRRKKIGA
jgi:hypothetical protein